MPNVMKENQGKEVSETQRESAIEEIEVSGETFRKVFLRQISRMVSI